MRSKNRKNSRTFAETLLCFANCGIKTTERKESASSGKEPLGYRIGGEIIRPWVSPSRNLALESVRKRRGLGRWIYCKYCYKSVRPLLSGINQVVCGECGYGLTPDFFTFKALKRFLAGGDYEKIEKDDRNSEEAKAWLRNRKLR